jgi:hypothetical protein
MEIHSQLHHNSQELQRFFTRHRLTSNTNFQPRTIAIV